MKKNDLISREVATNYFVTNVGWNDEDGNPVEDSDELRELWTDLFNGLPSVQPETCAYWDRESNFCALHRPSAQPEQNKYEYHYDHTDCIWYRPEARNRCPVTCAQYRDGWNDAMNYIFRDGKGYRPYRRGERYE